MGRYTSAQYGKQFKIVHGILDSIDLLSISSEKGFTTVILNQTHPFYEKMKSIERADELIELVLQGFFIACDKINLTESVVDDLLKYLGLAIRSEISSKNE